MLEETQEVPASSAAWALLFRQGCHVLWAMVPLMPNFAAEGAGLFPPLQCHAQLLLVACICLQLPH